MNGTKTIRSKVSWLGAVKIWESFTQAPQRAPRIREALARSTAAPLDFDPCDDCRRGTHRLQGRGGGSRKGRYLPQTEMITPPATISVPPSTTCTPSSLPKFQRGALTTRP